MSIYIYTYAYIHRHIYMYIYLNIYIHIYIVKNKYANSDTIGKFKQTKFTRRNVSVPVHLVEVIILDKF